MALIDVVKWNVNDSEFCYKFPSEDLRIGTQLIVYTGQTAFFVKGGKIYDTFTAGQYTINSLNIPLLNKIINIPFGGDSPFQAEVWFVNQISKLDIKWGTLHPIQLEDPLYNIIIPVRAFGQYGIHISDPKLFLESLIGNMSTFSEQQITQYFKGKIITQLNALIANKIARDKISILDINAQLIEMSEYCNQQLNMTFNKYGIQLLEFSIMAISTPNDDPSLIRLKEAKDLAARLKITGEDVYRMERSYNVLDKAASNEGSGGQMLSMGAGLGIGIGVGNSMGNITSQYINTPQIQTPPPLPNNRNYYLYINGQQIGGQSTETILEQIRNGIVTEHTLIWTPGMSSWERISTLPEFQALFIPPTI